MKTSTTIKDVVINPLIDPEGETVRVSAALGFLSRVFSQVDEESGLAMTFEECFGLDLILRTCSQALDAMNALGPREK